MINGYLKKGLGLILAASLVVCTLCQYVAVPVETKAQDFGEYVIADELPENILYEADMSLEDRDDMLLGYFESRLSGNCQDNMPETYAGSTNASGLTKLESAMYEAIKAMAVSVAAGDSSSTEVSVSISDVYGKKYWSAQDLGVSSVYRIENNYIYVSDEAKEAISNMFVYDYKKAVQGAIRDCPYEFYWSNNGYQYNLATSGYTLASVNGEYMVYFVYPLTTSFYVDTPYAGSKDFTTDVSKTSAAKTAADNARSIVASAADMTDYHKLTYYLNKLCELTDYAYYAVSSDYSGDNRPWQVINMFDGDDDTKVVCEGYAKSFQYLCELTQFDSKDIYAISVSGTMYSSSGSGGGHMWNILHMDDGKNYLVDVTNCDYSTVDTSLFMAVPSSGDYSSSYKFKNDYYTYTYSSSAKTLYSEDMLTLADTGYTAPSGMGLDQSSSDDTISNLVVYVNFSDTTHSHINSNYGRCFQENANLKELFYGTDSPRSLRYYLNKISYGNVKVANIFPQYDNATGKIVPVVLDKTASEYGSDVREFADVFVKDVSEKLIDTGYVTAAMNIDRDNDGCIDNLTIIVACEDGNTNTIFCGLAGNYAGVTSINGKRVAAYNIIPEGNAYMGSGQSGIIIHEFMHSLGFPDLYRSSVTPVGTWDIMSSVYLYLQYPLAYTRSSVGKWFDIPVVTKDKTGYSIYSAEAASDVALKENQAVILSTPYSDNEFFVVEYRKQTSLYDATYPLDASIYGSGLVIYRVNNNVEYKTNTGSSPYYIYVFRPGDTYSDGIEAANGTPENSYLSEESGRTEYGLADLSKGLKDGAITYSDGTNSGIVISNVGSASGNSITFDITFTDIGDDYWNTQDSQNYSGDMSEISACTDDSGNIYVAEGFMGNKKLVIYKTADGRLSGSAVATITDYSSGGKVVNYNGSIYVTYITDSYQLKVCRLSGNEAVCVYTSSSAAGNELAVETGEDGIYVAYTSDDCNTVYVIKYDGNVVSDIGSMTASYAASLSVTVSGAVSYVAYREFFNNNYVVVKRYSGSSWDLVGDLNVQAVNIDIANDGTCVYLAICKNAISGGTANNVWVYDKNQWNQASDTEYDSSDVVSARIVMTGNKPGIFIQNGTGGLKAVRLSDGTYSAIGSDIASANVQDYSGVYIDGTLYAVYCDYNTQNMVIKSFDTDADYSQVDAALAKVPKDLSDYSEETANAVRAAVAAVVRGKKASEQAAVDAMAKAIEDAVASLKFIKNGIFKADDGNFYYYVDDEIDTTCNGLKKNVYDDSWWLIKDGVVNSDYTGFYENGAGKWYVITGKIDINFSGLAKEGDEWLCVKNGKCYPDYTGMLQNGGSWWYVVDGKLATDYNGLYTNDGGTWFIKGGKIFSDSTGIFQIDGTDFYYVVNGRVAISHTGLVPNNNAFWYIKDGVLTSVTGIVEIDGDSWYVVNGKLATNLTSITIDNVTYELNNGKIISLS